MGRKAFSTKASYFTRRFYILNRVVKRKMYRQRKSQWLGPLIDHDPQEARCGLLIILGQNRHDRANELKNRAMGDDPFWNLDEGEQKEEEEEKSGGGSSMGGRRAPRSASVALFTAINTQRWRKLLISVQRRHSTGSGISCWNKWSKEVSLLPRYEGLLPQKKRLNHAD